MKDKFLFSKGFTVFGTEEYAVSNPISKSRYGETYRISRKRDGRPFLMKVYLTEKMPEALRFNGRPAIMEYLDSSNMAEHLSISSWGNFHAEDGNNYPYVISSYFEDGLLSDTMMTHGPMDAGTSVRICLDIARILCALRTESGASFVHADLCPDNIMLGKDRNGDGRAYLIDNDHMQHVGDDGRTARSACFYDTDLRYAASESFSAFGPVANSDVYSLGLILYECHFGCRPWEYDEVIAQSSLAYMHAAKILGARSAEVTPPYTDNIDSMIIMDLFKKFTAYGPPAELQSERPSVHEARSMLLAAWTAIVSPRPQTASWMAYRQKLLDSRKTVDGGIYGPPPSGQTEPASSAKDQEVVKSDGDEAQFTNAELNYTPLVKEHDPEAKGFLDVAGMDELKELVQKRILFFINNPEIAAEYKIDIPNGMLLYGPPGCGKTFFAEKFAEQSGYNFALVKASDLGSTWVHGTQGKIAMLFNEARAKAPCVICLDEFDAFAPARDSIQNANISGEVNEFLSQLNNCGKDRIFVVATTNNPEGIDSAVLRSGRLDHRFYVPVPDEKTRRAVLRLAVEKRPHSDEIDYRALAKRTEGYVTSDLSFIVNDAAMNAAYARVVLSNELLMQAIDNYRPSVPRSVLREHEEIRAKMESQIQLNVKIVRDDKILT